VPAPMKDDGIDGYIAFMPRDDPSTGKPDPNKPSYLTMLA